MRIPVSIIASYYHMSLDYFMNPYIAQENEIN